MRESLNKRMAKLEHKIKSNQPTIDLVKHIQEIGKEKERLSALSEEEFEAFAQKVESLPRNKNDLHLSAERTAVLSIQQEKAMLKYLKSTGKEIPPPPKEDSGNLGVLSLIRNR